MPAARRISSRAMVSPPCSSPSYSSSSLPVIEGTAAYTSLIRGTTGSSSQRRARRSALEIAFSSTLIGSRWLTPERLSTRLSSRASNATRSITSSTKSGTLERPAAALGPRLLRGDLHAELAPCAG